MLRKLAAPFVALSALIGAGAALGGQAATNPNGEFVDLNVAVSPPVAGTAKAPQGVAVAFDSFTGNRINGNLPSHNTSITVRFNNGFAENGNAFPGCAINLKGLTTCPRSTQIGGGDAEAAIPGTGGAPPTFVAAKLAVYNGKPYKAKNPTLIVIGLLNGKPVTELDFQVKQQRSGPYGLAFSQILFPDLGPSSGPGFSITKFSVRVADRTVTRTVRGKRVKIHLITAPTTCNGAWRFAQVNSYSDSGPVTATDSQPCTKRR